MELEEKKKYMIGNASNLANAIGLMEVFGIIYNILTTHWIVWSILIALILGGRGIMGLIIDWYARKNKRLNSALKKVVKIIQTADGKDTCEYSQQELDNQLKICAVKMFLWNHGALRRYKRTKRAKKDYETVKEEVSRELPTIVNRDVWSKTSFDISPFNRKEDTQLRYYWCDISSFDGGYMNYNLVDAIIKKSRFNDIEPGGQILLQSDIGNIAKIATKSEREELKGLINAVMEAKETKKLVKKVDDAKEKWEKADEEFKKKLAKIVRNLEYKTGGLK